MNSHPLVTQLRFARSASNSYRNLLKYGATDAECEYLCSKGSAGRWAGNRVELNAMSSRQFLDWLDARLTEAGVTKFVPDEESVLEGYRRALSVKALERVAMETCGKYDQLTLDDLPDGLLDAVRDYRGGMPWDEYLYTAMKHD